MSVRIPRRAAALLLAAPAVARAQDQTLRLIIPQPPGGATDVLARLLIEPLSRELGRNVVIDNRPGANGIVSINALKQSRPDGNTVLLGGVSIFAFNPNLFSNLPYDPWADFTWIAPIADTPFAIIVGRRTGITTMQQYVERARAQPERITYGSAGNGNSTHLGMEMVAEKAGIRLTHVPFAGSAPALTAIIAGDIDGMFTPLGSIVRASEAGQVVPLVTMGRERSPALPSTPTLREAGLGDITLPGWYAFVGPAGMPPAVVERINTATRAVVDGAEVTRKLRDSVLEPISGTAQSIQDRARMESSEIASFIRRRGIRVE
ncbi:tripartite tricarboxylate transporter substrate binding protein [Roseococcus sp. SYP-B2431]|uniref:Bug family tripartite tricarboxylate transporter substrate binding protein n=1 Tax=Roseococcus sp. SYP-B2431 TaxID=2496640 RepID=UPI00103F6534|nr:tripartite tricarboxylate transporter substrate binding protein [Roseococcus sp. SYP-B2431]TCH97553.1 tripartite tricarboxylate transporter substrate binding protein [Roseococcus sp. SYP-B2431]